MMGLCRYHEALPDGCRGRQRILVQEGLTSILYAVESSLYGSP